MNERYSFRSNLTEKEYRDYLSKVNVFSFLQKPEWGDVKDDTKKVLCGIEHDGHIVGAAMVLIKRLISNYTVLYIPRGPVLDFSNQKILQAFVDGIKTLAAAEKAIMVRIDPNVIDESEIGQTASNYQNTFEAVLSALKTAGFKHNGLDIEISSYWQPRIQKAIPLFDKNDGKLYSEEAFVKKIPKRMKLLFCNDFHAKRGVHFNLVKGPHDLKVFTQLLDSTAERKNIVLRNEAYYEKIAEHFQDRAYFYYAVIHIDEYIDYQEHRTGNDATEEDISKKIRRAREKEQTFGNEIVIGASLVLMPGEDEKVKIAEYIYAGGNNYFPDVNCSRGMVYKGCIDALKAGCIYFNLGGTSGDPNQPLTKYKNAYKPDTFEYVGEFDLIVNRLLYRLYTEIYPGFRKIPGKIKGLLKRS